MESEQTLFDKIVNEAIQNNPDIYSLQIVVEKELLHHDILREMSKAGLLENLTFIGGTSLRAVYGSQRLSEDLDFTGGINFDCKTMNTLTDVIRTSLREKYQLNIEVTPPQNSCSNVNTWKVKVITRPAQKHIPIQRINIDVCSIPSHDVRFDTLKNHYGVDMGTNGLLIPVQSREEIFADKIVAMAFRPNKLKYRDLWDIAYLVNERVKCPTHLVAAKISDHGHTYEAFVTSLSQRLEALPHQKDAFYKEMRRFVPADVAEQTLDNPNYWLYLVNTVTQHATTQLDALSTSLSESNQSAAKSSITPRI